MRDCFVLACFAVLTASALTQEPAVPPLSGESRQSDSISAGSGLKDMFEAKVKVEWRQLL